jgi:hypothetical protein
VDCSHTLGNAFLKIGIETSLPPFFSPLLFSYPSPAPFSQTSASVSFFSPSPPAIHNFFRFIIPSFSLADASPVGVVLLRKRWRFHSSSSSLNRSGGWAPTSGGWALLIEWECYVLCQFGVHVGSAVCT